MAFTERSVDSPLRVARQSWQKERQDKQDDAYSDDYCTVIDDSDTRFDPRQPWPHFDYAAGGNSDEQEIAVALLDDMVWRS